MIGSIEAGAHSFELFKSVNLEVMSLATRRTQAFIEIPSRLGACRSPEDFFGEQLRFWQTAVAEYTDSYSRIFDAYRTRVPVTWGNGKALAGPEAKDAGDQKQDFMISREPEDAEGGETTKSKGARAA